MINDNYYDISVYDRPPDHFMFIAINLSNRQWVRRNGVNKQTHLKGIFNRSNHFLNTGGQELVDFLLDIATIEDSEIGFDFTQKQKFVKLEEKEVEIKVPKKTQNKANLLLERKTENVNNTLTVYDVFYN